MRRQHPLATLTTTLFPSTTPFRSDEAALNGKRALILSTPEQASAGRNVFALLGPLAGGLFDRATMHVPVSIVEEALVAAKEIGADFTVAIGGGSTTGLAKALSLRAGLPSLEIGRAHV